MGAGSGHHLGVFRFTGGMRPFSSVERVWDQTIEALTRCFRVSVHRSSDLDLRTSRSAARLLDAVDLGVLLLPYQRLPVHRPSPLLVLALGSLHKGAPWLAADLEQFASTDTVVVNSDTCLSIFDEIVNDGSMGVDLVPLGIDEHTFHPTRPSAALRRHFRIPQDAKVLIYVGRLSLQKNIHHILQLLSEIRRSGLNAYLLLVGDVDDFLIPEVGVVNTPELEEVIDAQVKRLKISRYVRRVAHLSRNDLASVLASADVGINLSTFPNENFGLAVVEMQACGLPVIVTDWGGHRDTTRDNLSAKQVPTMLSGLGPRLPLGVARNHTAELLARSRRGTVLEAAGIGRRYSLAEFEISICSAVERAILRPALVPRRPVVVNQTWFHDITGAIGASDDLRWTGLSAVHHPDLYQSILRHAATFTSDEVEWRRPERAIRAFDWTLGADGRLRSSDPRWSPCIRLYRDDLTADELGIMELVEQTYSTWQIFGQYGVGRGRSALRSLTQRGLVVPLWSMRRARREIQALRHSDRLPQ